MARSHRGGFGGFRGGFGGFRGGYGRFGGFRGGYGGFGRGRFGYGGFGYRGYGYGFPAFGIGYGLGYGLRGLRLRLPLTAATGYGYRRFGWGYRPFYRRAFFRPYGFGYRRFRLRRFRLRTTVRLAPLKPKPPRQNGRAGHAGPSSSVQCSKKKNSGWLRRHSSW